MFDSIIIPDVSYSIVFIIATVGFTELIKKFWKWKPIYPFIPLFFSIPFGFLQALLQVGFSADFANEMLKAIFTITAGAIASYDIIVKEIKDYIKKAKGEDVGDIRNNDKTESN